MTVVSGNITSMRIFAGVPWRRGVKGQCGIRKHRFSGLSDAMSEISQFCDNMCNIVFIVLDLVCVFFFFWVAS